MTFIKHIHKFILGKLKPDLTFLLKVSSRSSKNRLKKENLKIDMTIFHNHFMKKAQKSFLKIAKKKKNYFILESSKNDNLLEKKILKITLNKLKINDF